MTKKFYFNAIPEEMQTYIKRKVAEGFDSADDIACEATENFSDEVKNLDFETLENLAGGYTQQAVAAHDKEAATWPDETECDRLDAAFAQLERSGIVARQNFTCCTTCGSAEIGDEIKQARLPVSPQGYTFYHMQDTENAVDGHGLYLAYGDVNQKEVEAIHIGHQIVAVLEQFGLKPSWDGTANSKIFLPIKWQRRFRLARDRSDSDS